MIILNINSLGYTDIPNFWSNSEVYYVCDKNKDDPASQQKSRWSQKHAEMR